MDIDIDISSRFSPLKLFDGNIIPASKVEQGKLVKHNVGMYFQDIAIDQFTGFAAIPYKEAEDLGYFKFDFINNNALNAFESKEEMNQLLEQEPDWSLLLEKENVDKLFHLSGHFDLVWAIKPKSTLEIADVIAFIRPMKDKLLDKYLRNKKETRKELYTVRDKSHMKKSHAVAYALIVVLQLHLLKMGRL
jgi:hypothetical protein